MTVSKDTGFRESYKLDSGNSTFGFVQKYRAQNSSFTQPHCSIFRLLFFEWSLRFDVHTAFYLVWYFFSISLHILFLILLLLREMQASEFYIDMNEARKKRLRMQNDWYHWDGV